jgi:hypothetical protein
VLKTAIDKHDPWMVQYLRTSRFERLRADPEGRRLLEETEKK